MDLAGDKEAYPNLRKHLCEKVCGEYERLRTRRCWKELSLATGCEVDEQEAQVVCN